MTAAGGFSEADAIDRAVTAMADRFIADHPDDAWTDATLDDVLTFTDRILADPTADPVGKKLMAGALFEVWRRLNPEAPERPL
jgi:hypothetical protein